MNSTSTCSTRIGISGLSLLALLAIGCGDDDSPSETKSDSGAKPEDSGAKPADAGTPKDSGPTNSTDSPVVAALRKCGLVSDGPALANVVTASERDKCRAACQVAASCDDLEAALCDMDSAPGTLGTCLKKCDPACEGGLVDGQTNAAACDGEAQCKDGSDEANCDAYLVACDDGSKTNISYKCDGEPDCADESDEKGCPAELACGDGTTVSKQFLCDFEPDCANGKDEENCAATVCK